METNLILISNEIIPQGIFKNQKHKEDRNHEKEIKIINFFILFQLSTNLSPSNCYDKDIF